MYHLNGFGQPTRGGILVGRCLGWSNVLQLTVKNQQDSNWHTGRTIWTHCCE